MCFGTSCVAICYIYKLFACSLVVYAYPFSFLLTSTYLFIFYYCDFLCTMRAHLSLGYTWHSSNLLSHWRTIRIDLWLWRCFYFILSSVLPLPARACYICTICTIILLKLWCFDTDTCVRHNTPTCDFSKSIDTTCRRLKFLKVFIYIGPIWPTFF